ncbi:MAG: hypothetical protein QM749_04935 [Aquabacterium sp.]
MIRNLKDTTQKNTEQDWLKTNLAKFSRMLQGQKDLVTVGQLILSELAPVVGAQQAEFYVLNTLATGRDCSAARQLCLRRADTHGKEVRAGRGPGRPVRDRQAEDPADQRAQPDFRIASGLSENAALNVLVLPMVFEGAGPGRARTGVARPLQPRRTRPSSTSSPKPSAS